MAEGDVAVVRRLFESTNSRDFAAAMDCYADDVVLKLQDVNTAALPDVALGKEAVGAWFGEWFRTFGSDYHFDIEEVRDLGSGQVLLAATHIARGRSGGVPIVMEGAWLFLVRHGKIVRCDSYATAAAAKAAAGV